MVLLFIYRRFFILSKFQMCTALQQAERKYSQYFNITDLYALSDIFEE